MKIKEWKVDKRFMISVIVPIFKVEPYLRRCVDSILGQTYRDFELILVDDGSPDRCGEICDEYVKYDNRVVAIHRENGGLSAARNTGIEYALKHDAEYVTFIDSDDWVDPEYLEVLLRGCMTYNVKVSATCLRKVTGEAVQQQPTYGAVSLYPCHAYWQIGRFYYTIACAKLFHASLFAGIRFPEGRIHEDEFTTHLLVFKSQAIAVNEDALYAYYQRPESIQGSAWSERHLDVIDALEGQIAFFKKLGDTKLVQHTVHRLVTAIIDLYHQLMTADRFSPWRYDLLRRIRIYRKEYSDCFDLALTQQCAYVLHPVGGRIWAKAAKVHWLLMHNSIALLLRNINFKFKLSLKIDGVWRLKRIEALHSASEIDIVLTLIYGGGAALYVTNQINRAPSSRVTFVLRLLQLKQALSVETWHNRKHCGDFIILSLSDLSFLAAKKCRIIINDLVQWENYRGSASLTSVGISGIIKEIISLRDTLNAKLIYLVHDYFCVCPKYQLMSPDGFYCRSEVTGKRCVSCLAETGIDRKAWLSDFRRLLSACDEVRTFSEDTQKRIMAVFPGINPTVVPHRLLCDFRETPKLNRDGICIGVFGFIYPAKGSLQVIELGHYLKRIGSTVRIVVVGRLDPAGRAVPDNVKVLGEYKKEDLVQIIEREGINVAWFSSVCPETFSYVTHELMALGLPIVCYDVGAPKDCVREYGKGMVIPEMSVESTWKTIQELTAKMGVKQNA